MRAVLLGGAAWGMLKPKNKMRRGHTRSRSGGSGGKLFSRFGSGHHRRSSSGAPDTATLTTGSQGGPGPPASQRSLPGPPSSQGSLPSQQECQPQMAHLDPTVALPYHNATVVETRVAPTENGAQLVAHKQNARRSFEQPPLQVLMSLSLHSFTCVCLILVLVHVSS